MFRLVVLVIALCLCIGLLIFLVPWEGDATKGGAEGSGPDRRSAVPPGTRSAAGEEALPVPRIVSYLRCEPSFVDGQGTAVCTPSGPVRIGSRQTFEIEYTVGEAGIVPGGFILLQVSLWWEWTPPQQFDPGRPGYVEVETSFEDPSLKTYALTGNRVLVFSDERGFHAGDKVTFRYRNARVDIYAEEEELFQIFVDGDGDGHHACIQDPPRVRLLPYPSELLVVNGPSRGAPGDTVEIRAAPLDRIGNWTDFAPGTYGMKVFRDGDPLGEEEKRLDLPDRSVSFPYTLPGEGIYLFEVRGPSPLKARSNVLLCQEGRPSLNLYFGDLHGHSRLSDGTGTPEDYYRFAREAACLDMAALTDHADYGTIPIRGEVWSRIKKAANDAYEPGRFVTFLGFEWTNWEYGHRNVYYRDGDGPVFRSFEEESDTPQELWRLIDPFEAMTVAHHVGGGPIHTDWSVPPGSKEWLVEICSVHGSSEYYGGEGSIYSPVEGAFVRDALGRGYRLGIIASGDTHDGHPGHSVRARLNGLVGVFAPELTREAIWDAFRRRHVYGTSGPKIILFFRVADAPMGSETVWAAKDKPVPISLMTVACDEIEVVEIIRNGQPVFREPCRGMVAQLLLEDSDPPEGTNWYYARVLQRDGNMAWSSPVWVQIEKN